MIITDCLGMVAANPLGAGYVSRINNCLKAGCDIVLISFTLNSLYKVIKKLDVNEIFANLNTSNRAQQSSQRINDLIHQAKPVDYYLNLIESSVYQTAIRNVLKWNEIKPRIPLKKNAVLKPKQGVFESNSVKSLKNLIKPIAKHARKHIWLWEIFSSIYLWVHKVTIHKVDKNEF